MRPNKDDYYMALAFVSAERAGCPKRKVGAVITDKQDRILSVGYNSPARHLPTCTEVFCGAGIEGNVCISPHAEQSAITTCRDIQSAKTIYITCSTCTECTKLILGTPIERIVFAEFHKTWNQTKRIWIGDWTYLESWDPTKGNKRIEVNW